MLIATFKSRLWIKGIFVVLLIVGLCSLSIAIYCIPLTWQITYRMEKKFAISQLDRVLSMVAVKYAEMEQYRKFAIQMKKQEMKDIVSVVYGYVNTEYNAALKENAEDVTRIQDRVIRNVRNMRYGNNDYVFISDFDYVMICHPDDKLHGKDCSGLRGFYGKYMVRLMVGEARIMDEAFINYWWHRLGKNRPSEKLAYTRVFPPWHWVLGTGIYIDDIEEEVARRQKALIGELRTLMNRIVIGETGYMYIFDSKMNMIIHPNPKLEGINFEHIKNPLTGESLAIELAATAHQEDNELVYVWDRPTEPGNYVYDKISWVAYFKGFDWYIGSSVYTDELSDNSRLLAKRMLLSAIIAFIASLVLGGFFLKRLLRPIEHLSKVALQVQTGDLEVRSGIQRHDEIGILANEFDTMVEQLARHHENLEQLVDERTRELTEANRNLSGEIAERKQAEKAFLESEARFRLLIEKAPLGIAMIRGNGEWAYINANFTDMFGYVHEDVPTGRDWLRRAFPDPTFRKAVVSDWQVSLEAVKSGEIVTRTFEVTCKDGSKKMVLFWHVALSKGDNMLIQEDITESHYAQEMLKRHNEYLSALHQTTLGLIGRRELTDLLETLIQRAAQLLNTTDGLFYLADPGSDDMELKVGIGRFVKYIGMRQVSGEGLCGKVWQTGEPTVIDDYSTWSGQSEKMKDDAFGAAIAVPLKSDGQVSGVIAIASSRADRTFGDEDVEMLTRFAGIASIALDNALLYQTTREAREAAEAANRAKSDFLASMSHEIRTPMNAILGMAELLSESPLNPEQQKYVRISRNSGQGLLDIINDILDISKVEAGQLVLEHTSFDLREVIEGTCELMALKTDEKGLELICRVAPDVPGYLMGDPVRLRQILINLLGNAVKFTHEGEIVLECGLRNADCGTVRLTTQVRDSESEREEVALQFSVRDTGIGIPEAKQKAVFERFTQADSSTTREYGGTGLGLNICQRLVELMDGEIWVEGKEGEGSTFAFTARFGIDKTPRDRKKPKEVAQDQKMETPSEVHPLRILLVEDAKENRIVVKAFLKKTPHAIDVAENGRIGVDKFLSGEYDLILMDMRMPVMDGYTATGEIRKWEKAHKKDPIPIIALTAHALREDKQKCLDAGCTDYLPKPLKKQDLLDKVGEYSGEAG